MDGRGRAPQSDGFFALEAASGATAGTLKRGAVRSHAREPTLGFPPHSRAAAAGVRSLAMAASEGSGVRQALTGSSRRRPLSATIAAGPASSCTPASQKLGRPGPAGRACQRRTGLRRVAGEDRQGDELVYWLPPPRARSPPRARDPHRAGDERQRLRLRLCRARARLHDARDPTGLCTGPYPPRTNGKVERFFRTLLGGWAYGAI